MEIRLSVCLAFLLVVTVSHSSEALHSMSRRETKDIFYQDDGASDTEQNDFASDTEQNDAGDGDEDADMLENVTMLTRPEAYNVAAGQGVRLDCRLNQPDLSSMVQWTKNGDLTLIMLGASTLDPEKYTLNGTDLIIKNLSQEDTGLYKCIFLGADPNPSVEHHVTVHEKPKVLGITATDDKPVQGTDVTLTCTVSGWPTPKIIWSKSEDTGNVRLGEGENLVLRNVNAKDTGKYLCYAMGQQGADTKAYYVTVQKKHHNHVLKTTINSAIGVEAFMQCSVHEREPIIITWYKGNQELDPSLYTTSGTHSNLTITPRSDDDFGTYTCQARNDEGTHKRSTVLVERPVIEKLEYEDNKISWTVHSHQPLIKMEIHLIDIANGNETTLPVSLPSAKTNEYDISYVVDSESVKPGSYEIYVKVENTKGVSENDNQVIFEQPEAAERRTLTGGYTYGAASSQHPTAVLISTVLMYLLVRMM